MRGRGALGFRGAATLDPPIARLVGVLLDPARSTDWVDRLVGSGRLRELEDGGTGGADPGSPAAVVHPALAQW